MERENDEGAGVRISEGNESIDWRSPERARRR